MATALPNPTLAFERAALSALGAAFALGLYASAALGQQTQPVAPPAAQVAPAPAPAPNAPAASPTLPSPPDVLSAIGRLIDRSISSVNDSVKGAGETLGVTSNAANDLARGAADAAGTIARLPSTNVVSGWERCATAPNGAPDCEAASTAICKAKGFARGSSVDITSAHKCPAQVWLEGRPPSAAECREESFVSRAVCQ